MELMDYRATRRGNMMCKIARSNLEIGKRYYLPLVGGNGKGGKEETNRMYMTCVDILPHFARFRTKSGFTHCFRYWELYNEMRKEAEILIRGDVYDC